MEGQESARRKAVAWAGMAAAALPAALLASILIGPGSEMAVGVGAFAGIVICGWRAMVLWDTDSKVFAPRRPPFPRIVAAAALSLAAAAEAPAQQTIFNVPTADVLDRGKLYFETDWLWRPNAPGFATGSPLRVVYGFGENLEGGLNLAGINSPGRSAPTASSNLKWQPYRSDALAVTAGAFGLFFLRGARDGSSAAMAYAHAAVKLPTGTRLTAGGWWASSGYAGPGTERGGLFGLEQPVTSNLSLAADWYTGHNGLGYASPGVIVTAERFVLYAAYSIKNGNSRGNGLLLELGFNAR